MLGKFVVEKMTTNMTNGKCLCILLYFVSLTLAVEDTTVWTDKKKLHKAKTLRYESMVKLAKLSEDPDEMKYFKDVLLKPMLRVRVPDTEGNRLVRQHIHDFMTHYGWKVDYDQFVDVTPMGQKTFTNIIATQNPGAPRKLVFACHHDSKYFTKMEFIGATDSAVPCAMMLDMALTMNDTLWKDDPNKARDISLQFIFFDGEEAFETWSTTDSTYGARHLADKLQNETNIVEVERDVFVREIDTLDLMVLLDLIGTETSKFHSWFPITDRHFQRLSKIELKLVKENLLELPQSVSNKYFSGSVASGNGIPDDHTPFLEKGVPILHLISYPFPKEWHTASDNAECLHYPTINDLNMILRIFVAEYLHLSP